MEFISYPKIYTFRSAYAEIKEAYINKREELPKLRYISSVKLHGTNSAIVKHIESNEYTFQSRNRIITIEKDNLGFAQFMSDKNYQVLFDIIEKLHEKKAEKHIAIFGEYAGLKIQSKVAISKLPRMFLIFAIRFDFEWLDLEKFKNVQNIDEKIYNMEQFERHYIDIDFKDPAKALEKISELTDKVNDECPVAKSLGEIGIGEGLVWTCLDNPTSRFWFKSKGEDHQVVASNNNKEKIAIEPDKIENVNKFVDNTLTENRLNQGIEYLKENNLEIVIKNIGIFIRWVVEDIIKEESDVVVESNLDEKMIKKEITTRAVIWYKSYCNN